jgi:cobyrinic acid a,c-diamide synthase
MNRLLISAAHKSSGKTTLCIGLCAALKARGLAVQPFKKGPDYIDPMWLGLASGRDCHNLDFFLMPHDEIRATFASRSRDCDIALIEGNKGLYDGLDLGGSNSNAALATLLEAPVVLVIDARGMTRGIAPLILGYQAFDPNIRIAGVILNQLGGSRHESKLRAVIEHYTDVPVLGAVHHDERLAIVERHLGLMPSNETGAARDKITAIAEAVARQVDLDKLVGVARSAPATATLTPPPSNTMKAPDATLTPPPLPRGEGVNIRLGIARDEAFGFYYPGDLEALQAAGAELVPFNTLRDTQLPAVDTLFIGGGFPEVHLEALAANTRLKQDIRNAIENGLPAYAECGGLMYLSRRLRWGERTGDMVGVIPGDVVMYDKPQGRGYVRLRETTSAPWPLSLPGATRAEIPAHEFHYSRLENLPASLNYAYEVKRGQGVDGRHDGIVHKNLLACYCHLRDLAGNHWAARFVDFARRHKQAARGRH